MQKRIDTNKSGAFANLRQWVMKKGILFCGLLLLVSCNNTTIEQTKKQIEKTLHGNKFVWWGIYDNHLESKEVSYTFYNNGKCDYSDEEHLYGEFAVKLLMPMCFMDGSWNVDVVNDSTIYLRCGLDVYRVLQYNNTCFQLLNSRLDTIYLYKSDCQSAKCLIPDKMPVPIW